MAAAIAAAGTLQGAAAVLGIGWTAAERLIRFHRLGAALKRANAAHRAEAGALPGEPGAPHASGVRIRKLPPNVGAGAEPAGGTEWHDPAPEWRGLVQIDPDA